nr:hypothetical protein [Tanacetum cinerariifolium]
MRNVTPSRPLGPTVAAASTWSVAAVSSR